MMALRETTCMRCQRPMVTRFAGARLCVACRRADRELAEELRFQRRIAIIEDRKTFTYTTKAGNLIMSKQTPTREQIKAEYGHGE